MIQLVVKKEKSWRVPDIPYKYRFLFRVGKNLNKKENKGSDHWVKIPLTYSIAVIIKKFWSSRGIFLWIKTRYQRKKSVFNDN